MVTIVDMMERMFVEYECGDRASGAMKYVSYYTSTLGGRGGVDQKYF